MRITSELLCDVLFRSKNVGAGQHGAGPEVLTAGACALWSSHGNNSGAVAAEARHHVVVGGGYVQLWYDVAGRSSVRSVVRRRPTLMAPPLQTSSSATVKYFTALTAILRPPLEMGLFEGRLSELNSNEINFLPRESMLARYIGLYALSLHPSVRLTHAHRTIPCRLL